MESITPNRKKAFPQREGLLKPWHRASIAALLLGGIGIAIAVILFTYYQFVSQRIYDDNTGHLSEVYSQVNHSFRFFLERNWGNLNDWDNHLYIKNDADTQSFLEGRQKYWNFTQFYFLAEDGSARTMTGEPLRLELAGIHDALFQKGEHIMANERTPDGQTVTIFAIPVSKGIFQGFEYTAIALSYTSAAMARSLETDAFSGQSVCFVVDTAGDVILSTQEGGSVFGNYLSYLGAASDLDDAALEKLRQDWKDGTAGVTLCDIGGTSYYISYRSVGYQDCVLLGIVPRSIASTRLLLIQRVTIDVLIKIFLLVMLLAAAWFLHFNYQKTRKNKGELKYREAIFETLSDNVDDIFLLLDTETFRVDYVSSNVERLLGISPEAVRENVRLLEDSATELPPDAVRDGLGLQKDSTAGVRGILCREHFLSIPVNGSDTWERKHTHQETKEERWYRETVYHKMIQGTEKYLIVLSDRTDDRQMKQNLQAALDTAKEANEAKSVFLSNMSHDIRTPMNAIIGFSVLLARDADNPVKVREYTRKISASSSHLLSLINDVLDMSKIESGKTTLNISAFSLPDQLEELYTILLPQTKAKKQTFEYRVEGRPAEMLMGDKMRLNQILLNLLSNAIKYTPEGGRIDFSVKNLLQDEQEQGSQHIHLLFTVEDNGLGMSEEFQKTVFKPFTREVSSATRDIQGTGLGMAITKNLVDLMRGSIAVKSTLGEGSTFTVELSFDPASFEEDTDFWTKRHISRVLVADDDEATRLEVQAMMQDTGVAVEAVPDGAAAVEAAIQAWDRKEPFHAILLDWQMPVMDGVEAARQIRAKLHRDIPILVLTSYDWNDIEDEARAAGIDAFMPKPFFVSTFQKSIETLERARAVAEDPAVATAAEENENVLKGMLFLLAEDNDINVEILSEMLDVEGARCERAENGMEALEMFQKSNPGYYDMILMDVQMPVMDGYTATRAIRACGHPAAKTIPIIAMTANAFAEDERNARIAGMDAHLAKPVDMNAVKATIGRLRREGRKGGIETDAL